MLDKVFTGQEIMLDEYFVYFLNWLLYFPRQNEAITCY